MTKGLASIGVPVFNEARYLENTLRNLLDQDYEYLELVVTDNGSTDETEAICVELARADPRIRYERWPVNRGAIESFRDTLLRARGEFFCWIGGHDLLEPSYVSTCVERLEARDDVILAYTMIQHIDENDAPLDVFTCGSDTMAIDDSLERLKHVVWNMKGHIVCGVWKRDELLKSDHLPRDKWGWDPVLVAERALHGRFAETRQPLLNFRTRPSEGVEERKLRILAALNPRSFERRKRKSLAALYREQRNALTRVVRDTDHPYVVKLRARCSIWACFALRHNAVPLAGLLRAGAQAVLPEKLRQAVYGRVQKWV